MGGWFSLRSYFVKPVFFIGTLALSACAFDFSGGIGEKSAGNRSSPSADNIVTKTKFKAGKAFGKASERVVRSAYQPVPRGGGRAVVGKPYKINGRWYRPRHQPKYNKVGIASWYGPNFHGRKTANGEIYDQTALSAAHPTLPLPSYVRVTNLANKRTVIVRVNDRGPFHKARIIDLSYRTAELLGTRAGGLAKVRVEYVGAAPVDAKDEKYLLASYVGPGSTKPSEVAAREKLIAYARGGKTKKATPDKPEIDTPKVVVASNASKKPILTTAQPIANAQRKITNIPVKRANADEQKIGLPLELRPTLLVSVPEPEKLVKLEGGQGVRIIRANPSTNVPLPRVKAASAYHDADALSDRISDVFSLVIGTADKNWKLEHKSEIEIGSFVNKETVVQLVDELSRFGEVSLAYTNENDLPAVKIQLESDLPFALKAAQKLVPGAVLIN